MPGVERKMLERVGAEFTRRATSIVRYAPGSSFSKHVHTGGEEFLVLEGVFSDEYGDYPVGTYIRNPIGTSHTPYSVEGCTIFVKLEQFKAEDQAQKVIATQKGEFVPGLVSGLSVLPLHQASYETVALVRWQPGTQFKPHRHYGGEEILVLEGVFSDEFGDYESGTWLRNADLSEHTPYSEKGCLIYVKTGHLLPEHINHLQPG